MQRMKKRKVEMSRRQNRGRNKATTGRDLLIAKSKERIGQWKKEKDKK